MISKNLLAISEDELSRHNSRDNCWVAIDQLVYDLTNWLNKHPGGAKIIGHFAGQDATDAWIAMHSNRQYASKFLSGYLIGKVDKNKEIHHDSNDDIVPQHHVETKQNEELLEDFRELRKKFISSGLMDANLNFFALQIIHIFLIEISAYLLMSCFGCSLFNFIFVAVLLATAQAQSGWSQHDYGHHSIFQSTHLNRLIHNFVIGHMKGASRHWWNFRHNQHHVKTNVIGKDPDIAVANLFVLGERIPRIWGEKKRRNMPYHWQHVYFWFIGPPLLLPIYFHYENVFFMWKRRDWQDALWVLSFFFRFFYLYSSVIGWKMAFALYMFARTLESIWFVLVTQMNHIVMPVEVDRKLDWVTSQFSGTCNVKGSRFNDWFSGHLNYQIEHHLFPCMPRHNYPIISSYIKELSTKHHLNYVEKSLLTAILDIHRSLKTSGEIWWKNYNLHS